MDTKERCGLALYLSSVRSKNGPVQLLGNQSALAVWLRTVRKAAGLLGTSHYSLLHVTLLHFTLVGIWSIQRRIASLLEFLSVLDYSFLDLLPLFFCFLQLGLEILLDSLGFLLQLLSLLLVGLVNSIELSGGSVFS